MLSSQVEIHALEAKRFTEGGASILEIYREEDAFFKSMGTICNLVGKVIFGKRGKVQVGIVDSQKIKGIKEEYAASRAAENENNSSDFISTNDILTSSYMRASNCDVGLMAINYRNRVDGVTDSLAGNYEGVIGYQREDYASPSLIRKSLQKYKRFHADIPLLRGFFARNRAVLSMVTNWSGFYSHILLPGECTHVAHFPVFTTLNMPYVLTVGILFMVNENQIAVLSIEHPARSVLDT
eukprot:CAMPEP_0185042668 /NCGR_PEP_ID=MMETSP1103-20130426/42485_1 /TAXON_ID=36769 /ORGANISM="Paraphysomonas bandaiensis, Strain Caron Lab Isolate" /LENGTH=238 /DNA_ID=CAMNT_0027582773 /DNA_START=499 /DNA_END=1212 /DNA_ORIENTATION=+